MLHLWEKLKHYIVRAATIIAGSIVVIWFLTNFDFDFWNGMVDQGDSILGRIAKVFSWLFVPLGFGMGENGWMFVVAAFTGLIAKEMVVATLGTFAGVDDALDIETASLPLPHSERLSPPWQAVIPRRCVYGIQPFVRALHGGGRSSQRRIPLKKEIMVCHRILDGYRIYSKRADIRMLLLPVGRNYLPVSDCGAYYISIGKSDNKT